MMREIKRMIDVFTNGGDDTPYCEPMYDSGEIAWTAVLVADGRTFLEIPIDGDNPDLHEEVAQAICKVGSVLKQQSEQIERLKKALKKIIENESIPATKIVGFEPRRRVVDNMAYYDRQKPKDIAEQALKENEECMQQK